MSEKKLIPTTESVIENLTVTIKDNLKEFKIKQLLLVKENPFIKITDSKSYEAAKKSRTSLVSGRTTLEKQITTINKKLNPVKTFVKTEIESLIEVSKPTEDCQQAEVKRYEGIQEAAKNERERISEEKKQKIQTMIDEIVIDFEKEIKSLSFENIDDYKMKMESQLDEIDASKFEDLEIYFSGKVSSLKNTLEIKISELKKDQELLVSQSENRFQQFKSKWMERFMDANINNVKQLNTDFDTEVPEIDADTFFSFKDQFIQETNKFRDKLVDITNLCKLQQEKADEEKKKKETENAIKLTISNLDTLIETMELKDVKNTSHSIQKMELDFKKTEYYSEFKDLIETKLTNSRNIFSHSVVQFEVQRKENLKSDIKLYFETLELTVGDTTFETIIIYSSEISKSLEEIKLNKDYSEFKDLIEFNISKIENLSIKKNAELTEANKKFKESEIIRIEKEKEDEKLKKASDKKAIAKEKKRQKELAPFKKYATDLINDLNVSIELASIDTDVNGTLKEFQSDLSKLKSEYIVKINEI